MSEAVSMIRNFPGDVEIEASGGIDLRNVRKIAEIGVDFISVGRLTHSFRSLDFSLGMETL
jgi:nicotinate-nucleotide pyrophosphorylase (carboxylating)